VADVVEVVVALAVAEAVLAEAAEDPLSSLPRRKQNWCF
jgi:hypothetical protein